MSYPKSCKKVISDFDHCTGAFDLSVCQEEDVLVYRLTPRNKVFIIDDLIVSGEATQKHFMSQIQSLSITSAKWWIPQDGMAVARQALNKLPMHHIPHREDSKGKETNFEIKIFTSFVGLNPAKFETGLYRVLQALAQNPSRHLEDLPLQWKWTKQVPFPVGLRCLSVEITGIKDFKVVLLVHSDPKSWIPLDFDGRKKIHASIKGTMKKLLSLKRPKSLKQSFAKLPVEIISAIVEYLMPTRLHVRPGWWTRKKGWNYGHHWSLLSPEEFTRDEKADLSFLALDTRIRQIALNRACQVTTLCLGSFITSPVFEGNLKFLRTAFDGQLLSRAQYCSCQAELSYMRLVEYPSFRRHVLVKELKFHHDSERILHNVCDLLDIRSPSTGSLRYRFVEGLRVPYRGNRQHAVSPIHFMVIFEVGNIRTTFNVTIPLPHYPTGAIDVVRNTDARQMMKLHLDSFDALLAPIMKDLAKKHDLEYIGLYEKSD